MALASQMARGQRIPSSSVAVYRAKRRARQRIALGVVLLVVLVGGGLLWLLNFRDSGKAGGLGPQSANAQPVSDPLDGPASKPEATPPPPPQVRPEPATFTMGARPDPAAPPQPLPESAPQPLATNPRAKSGTPCSWIPARPHPPAPTSRPTSQPSPRRPRRPSARASWSRPDRS